MSERHEEQHAVRLNACCTLALRFHHLDPLHLLPSTSVTLFVFPAKPAVFQLVCAGPEICVAGGDYNGRGCLMFASSATRTSFK